MAAPHQLILSPHGRLLLEQSKGDAATSAVKTKRKAVAPKAKKK